MNKCQKAISIIISLILHCSSSHAEDSSGKPKYSYPKSSNIINIPPYIGEKDHSNLLTGKNYNPDNHKTEVGAWGLKSDEFNKATLEKAPPEEKTAEPEIDIIIKNESAPPKEELIESGKNKNLDRTNVESPNKNQTFDECIDASRDYNSIKECYNKWRILHLKKIYERQSCISMTYAWGLVGILAILFCVLFINIYNTWKKQEWIIVSYGNFKIRLKTNVMIFILIITALYLSHYYMTIIYPIT